MHCKCPSSTIQKEFCNTILQCTAEYVGKKKLERFENLSITFSQTPRGSKAKAKRTWGRAWPGSRWLRGNIKALYTAVKLCSRASPWFTSLVWNRGTTWVPCVQQGPSRHVSSQSFYPWMYLHDCVCQRVNHNAPYSPEVLLVWHDLCSTPYDPENRLTEGERGCGPWKAAGDQQLQANKKPAENDSKFRQVWSTGKAEPNELPGKHFRRRCHGPRWLITVALLHLVMQVNFNLSLAKGKSRSLSRRTKAYQYQIRMIKMARDLKNKDSQMPTN